MILAVASAFRTERGRWGTLSIVQQIMSDEIIQSIRASYDQPSDEYARQLFNELQNKPLDRQLLDRFAAETVGRGKYAILAVVPDR